MAVMHGRWYEVKKNFINVKQTGSRSASSPDKKLIKWN